MSTDTGTEHTVPAVLRERLETAVKGAMRAREKRRLGTLRLIMAELKRIEVDERITLDDARILAVLDKMTKQRKDSLAQYKSAGRADLVEQEASEIELIQEFLPEGLDEAAIKALVDEAVVASGASSMQDMGKVMAALRPKVQGRADMGQVSALVKSRLG